MNSSSSSPTSTEPLERPADAVVLGTATGRLDKWLWSVRVFKTRSLAAESCRSGNVEINGHPAKPARDVRAGEVVNVRQGLMRRTFRVLGVPESRVGARLVPGYAEDRTSPEELAKARERSVQQLLARERGSGRPTKKDRRALEDLFGAD